MLREGVICSLTAELHLVNNDSKLCNAGSGVSIRGDNYGLLMHFPVVTKLRYVTLCVFVGNTFDSNGLAVLNLTATENVLLEVQNVLDVSVSNNMFTQNNGSCTVWLSADGGM